MIGFWLLEFKKPNIYHALSERIRLLEFKKPKTNMLCQSVFGFLNEAHVLALNAAHVLRLNKADVLAPQHLAMLRGLLSSKRGIDSAPIQP